MNSFLICCKIDLCSFNNLSIRIITNEVSIDKISEDWKLYLVGPMTEKFEKFLKEKMKNNSCLEKRTVIVGEVTDRDVLAELYKKCAIFTMPSRRESFGIAAIEALSKGDYLLLSDLQAFREVSMNEKYGKIFERDNIHSYVSAIESTCRQYEQECVLIDQKELEKDMGKYFSWESICEKLDAEIKHG